MEANQIGAGGLQSVSLYQQNQEKNVSSGQEVELKVESLESRKPLTVNLSPESIQLARRAQAQNLERKDSQVQQVNEQQSRQADSNLQVSGTRAPQPERIDLFA